MSHDTRLMVLNKNCSGWGLVERPVGARQTLDMRNLTLNLTDAYSRARERDQAASDFVGNFMIFAASRGEAARRVGSA